MTSAVGCVLLRTALAYAVRGIPVFPLAPGAKVPAVPKREGGRGFLDATTDAECIRAWWMRWPFANIGVPTGCAFDVLDVDPRHAGEATLAALVAEYGPLPVTVEAATGGGGRHVLFIPDGRVRCSAGDLGMGLDVRGTGGYVVAPPSVHESGRRYRWGPRAPLAPWPAWLLDMIAPPPAPVRLPVPVRVRDDGRGSRYGLAVLRRACEAVEAAAEGTRHHVLRRRARTVAGFVAGGELDGDLGHDCLLAAALMCGLPKREAERTWTWALTNGSAVPLVAPGRSRR